MLLKNSKLLHLENFTINHKQKLKQNRQQELKLKTKTYSIFIINKNKLIQNNTTIKLNQ